MRLWVTFVALLLAGCAFESEPCTSDEECPPETTCRIAGGADLPYCIATVPQDAGEGDDPDADDEPDTDVEDPDTDVSKPDTPAPDCTPVETCGDDEPNEGPDAVPLARDPVGCPGFRLRTYEGQVQSAVCADDADDFFLEYVPCENQTYKITAILRTDDYCGLMPRLKLASEDLSCTDDDVRCDTLRDGFRITALIRADDRYARPLGRFQVRVDAGDNGASYTLQVEVSQ